MSLYFDFDVGASGRRFRRAVAEDISEIELFLDRKHSEQIFGQVDIGGLIELSVLPICMINENKHVVGFMALNDHINVLGVDPGNWETWMRNMFQKFYLSRNTLFIHFMCCMDSVLGHFLEEACTSVFRNDVYLLHIILYSVCDQEHVSRYQILKKKTMYKYSARRLDDSETTTHVINVALRQDYCPKLKIRRAVEEDNDDIVDILDRKCPRLKELYGSYYISELVGCYPDSKRKIIVPEYQDHAVGVMCLNSDINYNHLQALYELRPYYGLMKATSLEKEKMKRANVLLTTFGEPIMMGQLGPFDRPSQCEDNLENTSDLGQTLSKENLPRQSAISRQKQYKVNFTRARKARVNLDSVTTRMTNSDDYNSKKRISPTPSQITLLLDEDPFDYEIVNIDKSLLSLSEALSCELLLGNKSAQSSIQSFASAQIRVCKRKKMKSIISDDRRDSIVPVLNGQPNAFMIELFNLRPDVDDTASIELLEVAFEIMKKYDYCIIRIPAADRPFCLLQHFTFVPIRPKRCSEYSLFIAHRASVLGKIRVRRAEVLDIPSIARFLQNMDGAETITMIEHSFLNNDKYEAFVFVSGLSIVGLGILEVTSAVHCRTGLELLKIKILGSTELLWASVTLNIRPPEQLNFIRAKFNIDAFHKHKYHLGETKTGFATVKLILVYPVFEVHFRFFAREMMRLSGSNTVIWMTAYRSKMVAHKSNTIVSAMVPLRPRTFQVDYSKIPELTKVAAMAKGTLPFNTWFLDKKLTSVPVVNVSTRILIIGASRTTFAFLNALLFDQTATYLRFNNITLISTSGLPYTRHTSAAVEMMFPKYHTTSEKYLKSVPYTYYVNTITGTVIEVNKQEKFVTLTNGSKYFYDMLFFFLGKQYQHPEYLKPLIEQSMKCTPNSPYVRLDVPNFYVEPDYINYTTPDNVFIINHTHEASNALKYVRNLLTEGFDFKVLVYGATIHAYCCLTALLEINIPPDSIVFVDPFPPENPAKARVSVFCNSNVDHTVNEVLAHLQVKVYRSYYFQSWTTRDNMVTHVEFLSQYRMINVECNAFFFYGRRGVNTQAFLAVNKAGMAYDAGILIDHQCRTKDPSIYAAGPVTAYYRRYFGATERHKYYDSSEVGEGLGNHIRNQLDPLFINKSERKRSYVRFSSDASSHPASDSNESLGTNDKDDESNTSKFTVVKDPVKPKDMLPHFVKPKVRYCKLPGGLQYLEVRSPGKKSPHHYVQSLHYRGVVMETFKSGYFKLHLTNDHIVDGITCITYEKYALENFRNLYGRSSVILNNVHLRYMAKKLDDFYEFFRSPWAYFLYHDQADDLFAMVKELLPKGTANSGVTLAEALQPVIEVVEDGTKNFIMRKKFEPKAYIESVTDYVMEWLSQNDILLPMYMQPAERMDFLHDMERNPMFRKRRTSVTNLIRDILMA